MWGPGMVNTERFPQGFEDHSLSWSRNPAPPPRPLVAIPEDMSTQNLPAPSNDALDILKKEMLGLTQTVKSLATQLVEKDKASSKKSQNSNMADHGVQNEAGPVLQEKQSNPRKKATVQCNPANTAMAGSSKVSDNKLMTVTSERGGKRGQFLYLSLSILIF